MLQVTQIVSFLLASERAGLCFNLKFTAASFKFRVVTSGLTHIMII
jgi:hypothetical protein